MSRSSFGLTAGFTPRKQTGIFLILSICTDCLQPSIQVNLKQPLWKKKDACLDMTSL